MAGSIISTYMMFLPEKTQWFCLIALGIIIFGIYIPYEERKKKKQQKKSPSKKPAPVQRVISRQSQPEDHKNLKQWDILKEAGLLTEEEYQEKKKKIR